MQQKLLQREMVYFIANFSVAPLKRPESPDLCMVSDDFP